MKYAIALVLLFSFAALADSASTTWPTRGTKVTCGGDVDGQPMKFHVVAESALLAGESVNNRILIYIDLRKPAQVRWLISDAVTDEQYQKREAVLAKLPKEDSDFVRALTATRQTEMYMGMTDGYITMFTTARTGQTMSISCQETAIPGAPVTE